MKKSFYVLLIILFVILTAIAVNTKRPPFTSVRIENKNITVAIQQDENDLRNTIKLRNDFSKERTVTTTENIQTTEQRTIEKTFQRDPTKKTRLKGKRLIKKIVKNQQEQQQEKIVQHQEQQPLEQQKIQEPVKYPQKEEYNKEEVVRNTVPDIKDEDEDRFGYRSVSWNIWRSNFVNQIVDDLGQLSMDAYPEGTWMYYSFDVDKFGNISNVKVFSPIVSKQDKQTVAGMLKGYAHKQITKFPENSKRAKTTVNGIVVISYFASRYTTPDDFSDVENIKYKY